VETWLITHTAKQLLQPVQAAKRLLMLRDSLSGTKVH